MAASKQASKHTHARVQCSPASVGLAQARPNDGEQRGQSQFDLVAGVVQLGCLVGA